MTDRLKNPAVTRIERRVYAADDGLFGFTLVAEVGRIDGELSPHSVDVTAYEVVSETLTGEAPTYHVNGSGTLDDQTTELGKALPMLTGNVKWDGCANITLGDAGYFHFCGERGVIDLGQLLRECYAITRELISTDED